MQDLNDMMVFLAVVETGSFTLAAERLSMPKANVSRKVTKLENTLGVTLLERTTRTQRLTEAGRAYIAHCKRIYDEAELAKGVADKARNSISGPIKLGCSVSIGQEILKPNIAGFLAKFPDVELQLNLTNQRVDMVEGGFDMLIRIGKLSDSSLIGKKLGCATRSLYTSPKYLASLNVEPNLENLHRLNWLVMSSSVSAQGITLFNANKEKHASFKAKLIVDDFSVIKQATIDGLGITVMPNYMCQKELESGKLVKVLPDWQLEPSMMYALYAKNRVNLPKINALLTFLQTVFENKLAC
ncbi:LysR family transcriptional regulator [Pseudoalteromonas sp. SSM20]|uniref:LysR family transcriptional regulator n=1 Tax=Pseudoalteromonas sp. SSM20 TaxID=3139394 RepID=UPI003BA86B9B